MKNIYAFVLVVLMGLGLALLPVCPVQFQVRQETTRSGNKIFPVYGRKFPFLEWKEAYANPESLKDAKDWIGQQRHWFPLLSYCPITGRFLPLDALSIPGA